MSCQTLVWSTGHWRQAAKLGVAPLIRGLLVPAVVGSGGRGLTGGEGPSLHLGFWAVCGASGMGGLGSDRSLGIQFGFVHEL